MKSIFFFFLLIVPVTGVAGETSVYYLYSDANSGEARMAKSGLHDEGEVVLRTLTDTVDGLERPRVFHSLHYSLAEDEIALASAGGSRNVSDLLTRYEIPTVFPGGNLGPDLVVLVPFEFTIWPSIFTIDKYSLETGVFTQVISGNFPALENYPYPSDPPIDRYRYRRSYFAMLEGLTYHHQTDTAYLGWAGKLYQVRAGSSSVTTPGSLVGALDFSVYGSGEVPDFSKLVIDEYQGQIFAAFGNRRSERKVRSQAVVFHESSYHLENGLRFKNDPFVAAPAVMEIDKASEANLLGRIRLDGLVHVARPDDPPNPKARSRFRLRRKLRERWDERGH